ncbi:T9SS type A sorting domain-containing protein [Flavobacterium sp.]|jgi:hypothetical protein|uniref:T9SS type A sorting domain-containing protein n=1 Tax=Flavobacterium sp. TaxID=239 RepID=UPI0037C018C3
MKYLILLFISGSIFGQDLHHQMISAQGKSVEIANGMLVSQSIGQQSAIGNYKNGYTVGQGFQQSNWKKYVNNNITTNISTITYPNPFVATINFQFSVPIKDKIQIEVFDIRGRLVFKDEKMASETLLTIDLAQLPSSNYLTRLTAPNYTYYSQILKK